MRTFEASQFVAFAHRPVVNPRDIRHLPTDDGRDYRVMTYTAPDQALDPFPHDTPRYTNMVNGRQKTKRKKATDAPQCTDEAVEEPYERPGVEKDHTKTFADGTVSERCGVLHFVNAWHQQGTTTGVSFSSFVRLTSRGITGDLNS
ncbi:hypothetical protein B0H12DRAFT_311459 [Mycena haematopus]|nr:hypothetical protein B0H12DRAFT_447146 [Mycena haematopus]KAJ7221051.1 hypothetical protein B0H12DRAFT_311459 [Mycena haematopus]